MICVFATVRTTIALRYVRGNGDRRAADLARQAVGLFMRKALGKSIGVKGQLDTLLPNNELAVV
jgi:hypothetical protein